MEKITFDCEEKEADRLRFMAKGEDRSVSSLLRKIVKEYK